MATISRVTTWNTGDKPTAAQLNAEFDNILTLVNGSISDANVSAAGAIDASKLKDATVLSRKLKPTIGIATASGDLSLTTGWQDVAGCTATINIAVATTVYVLGIFNFDIGTSNTGLGTLYNGTTQETSYARLVGEVEGTVSQVWSVNIAASTSTTIKLQAKSTAGGGTAGLTHTRMLYLVVAQ